MAHESCTSLFSAVSVTGMRSSLGPQPSIGPDPRLKCRSFVRSSTVPDNKILACDAFPSFKEVLIATYIRLFV